MKSTSRAIFWIILGSFFLSGVAGLIYQVVWTRYLALFLGHTSYAIVAVLVAFMGGLALGNAWLGAQVDSLRRPLFFYAFLEIGIGVYAIVFPWYYEFIHNGYLSFVRSSGVSGAGLLALKFVFASIAILPPTILMGATLPALTKYVTRSLAELRGKVAALYAINSSGAVVGTLLADWWWIPTIGLESVVLAAATMNLSVGLVSLILSKRSGEGEYPELASSTATAPASSSSDERFTPLELRLALLGIGVSGFVAMLYEVAWTRLLGLALGSSTHAYSLMLVTFISGIAAGGWIIYRWKRQAGTLEAFAWAELGLAGTLLASMFYYDQLPWWFARLSNHLNRQPATFHFYELTQAIICFGVMFIPAVCLGMTLPLVSRIATAELARTGRSVGMVFAVNTLGTVLGAALTGLVFLPTFGLARTIALGIGLNAFIGLLTLTARRAKPNWALSLAVPTVTLVIAWVIGTQLTPRWQKAFSIGLWRSARIPQTLKGFRTTVDELDLLYHKDGAGSTVAIARTPAGNGAYNINLRVNGKVDASTGLDVSTQLLASHIPALLKPDSSDTLIVGAGSGMSVGAMLTHPTVQRVDLVEISPEVVEVARSFFGPHNDHGLDHPKTHTYIEDAKSFLKTTSQMYDIIVTEPSNPWMAGVSAVFSKEYYEDCRARLKPGGLIAQWLQVYETDEYTFDMVIATYSSVFPYLSIWQTSGGDLLLVGSSTPVKVDLDATVARLKDPKVAADLKRIEIDRPITFFALQHVAMGDGMFVVDPESPIHSDFFPRLEYAAQRAFFSRNVAIKHYRVSELRSPRPRTFLGDWLAKNPLTADDCAALIKFFAKYPLLERDAQRSILYRWLTFDPKAAPALRRLAELAGQDQGLEAEFSRLAARPEFRDEDNLRDLSILRQYTGLRLLSYRGQRSAFYLAPSRETEAMIRAAIELDSKNSRAHRMHLAELYWDRGQDDAFLKLAQDALDPDPKFGPADFKHDMEAGRSIIARMLDTYTRRQDWANAASWARVAEDHGYLRTEGVERHERLELLVRKSKAAVNPDSAFLLANHSSPSTNATPNPASPPTPSPTLNQKAPNKP